MGPKDCGKTLLIKRMQTLSEEKRLTPFDTIPGTKTTESVDTINFKFKGMSYVFKELGGSHINEWENYAKSAKAIVFIFDAADFTKLATNIVWLNELLTNPANEQKPILIVLNKCDVPDCIRFNVIDEIIGFDRILNPSRLSFLEISSVVGVGLSDIFHWISEQVK